jgi:hypothetical protein
MKIYSTLSKLFPIISLLAMGWFFADMIFSGKETGNVYTDTMPQNMKILMVVFPLGIIGGVVFKILDVYKKAENESQNENPNTPKQPRITLTTNFDLNRFQDEYKNLNSGTINRYENIPPNTFDNSGNFDTSVFENNNYFNGDE